MTTFLLLVLSAPRAAYALDVEPNGTIATAEPIPPWVFDRGSIDSAADTDDCFEIFAHGDGALEVMLRDYDATASTVAMELQDGTGATLATASDDGLGLSLSYTVTDATEYYVNISASSGATEYDLHTTFSRVQPTITALSDTNPYVGDTLYIDGTDFGTLVGEVWASVGGVAAETVSVTDTQIEVVVPVNAIDGDVEISIGGATANGGAVTIGAGTPGPLTGAWMTAPDAAYMVVASGQRYYRNRIFVTFVGGADATDAAAVLDNALTTVANLTGWTEVGYLPYTNTYQVELGWSGSYTSSNYQSLMSYLLGEPDVVGANVEALNNVTGDAYGPGMDMESSWRTVRNLYAAYDIVAIDEAWRLYAATGGMFTPSIPTVVTLDSGLTPATVSGNAEVGTDNFHYFRDDGSGWNEKASTADWRDNNGHGTSVAAVIGAVNQGVSRWDSGSDGGASATGLNGVLAGLQQNGVDDNGDSTVDEAAEALPYGVDVFDTHEFSGTVAANKQVLPGAVKGALHHLSRPSNGPPRIVNMSLGLGVSNIIGATAGLDSFLRPYGANTLFVLSAGNLPPGTPGPGPSANQFNAYVGALHQAKVATLVVSGSNPSDGVSTDKRLIGPRSGPGSVHIAAPAEVWTTDSASTGYQRMLGTSFSAPLVSGVAAMLMSVDSAISAWDVRGILLRSATDLTGRWESTEHMVRLDAAAALASLLGEEEYLDRTMKVYVTDTTTDYLWEQSYDATLLQFEGSASSFDAGAEGCSVGDVEVDPYGDLVYLLCADSPAKLLVLAHDATGALTVSGSYTFTNDASSYSEMVISPEGYLLVPTFDSAGAEYLTVIDTFDGSLAEAEEEIIPSNVTYMNGAARNRTGEKVFFTTYGSSVSQLATVEMSPFERGTSDVQNLIGLESFSSASTAVHSRDVSYHPGSDEAYTVFYDSTSVTEVATTNMAGSFVADETINYLNQPYSITVNPSGQDDFGYVASISASYRNIAMVDVTGSPLGPQAFISGPSGAYARNAEFSDTGRFGVLAWKPSSSAVSVYAIPHDSTLSSTSGSPTAVTSITSFDSFSASLTSPRGLAITPGITVLSPRPGKDLNGYRKVVILVRNIDAEYLSYELDGSAIPACPDDAGIADGVSDTCVLDATAWSGSHTLKVTVHFTDGSTSDYEYRYL